MLASDEALADTSGKYYNQCELSDYAEQADDATAVQKLWDVSADLVDLS